MACLHSYTKRSQLFWCRLIGGGGGGWLPDTWSTLLLEVCGGDKPQDMQSLALQNTFMKWVSTVVLLQMEDALQQLIPPEQRGVCRAGRC